ncbi:signal peptidase I [Pleurocapsa sp. CCALA 161]|uniref:signal peptidase I n=1 Tax=Pleurocapsa sp. CCALA 161 TaxID=2107688 RepID=UPI000D060EAE|nr:signal peptidase I [Pleurocapsa sp. CCALA 161]PSB11892.1 signal peptidase I [Pleurocapsa sp. CCALA 161]
MSLTKPKKITNKLAWWRNFKENSLTVVVALALALIIRLFIAEPRYIPSESMFPTLATGDRLVVEKVGYKFHPPNKGDIIVFQPPEMLRMIGNFEKSQAFIKRVIAKSGDKVAVKDGIVYVNEQPLVEDYIAAPPEYELIPVTVPERQLFVMGDNRNNSNDSHIWGFLPTENVIGHAVFRFWPLDRIGTV